jgi:hypothetical protein
MEILSSITISKIKKKLLKVFKRKKKIKAINGAELEVIF